MSGSSRENLRALMDQTTARSTGTTGVDDTIGQVRGRPLVDLDLDRAFVRSALKRAAALEWQRQETMIGQLDVIASNRRINALHTVWKSMIEPGDRGCVWLRQPS